MRGETFLQHRAMTRRVRSSLLLGYATLLLLGLIPAPPLRVDEAAWDHLLQHHVSSGLVDYAGLAGERATLEAYLAYLGDMDPAALSSREARLAFWINAYNACVLKGVLKRYPLRSVKDVQGFFDKVRYRVAGRDRTLNEIEAEGRRFGDARVHFALVCASSSCPPLRSGAYVPERLEAQLTEQAKQFLSDPRRGLRLEGSTLWASLIFKWYAKDFVPGRLTPKALLSALHPDLPAALQTVVGERLRFKWIDYDWTLNDLNVRRTP